MCCSTQNPHFFPIDERNQSTNGEMNIDQIVVDDDLDGGKTADANGSNEDGSSATISGTVGTGPSIGFDPFMRTRNAPFRAASRRNSISSTSSAGKEYVWTKSWNCPPRSTIMDSKFYFISHNEVFRVFEN